MIFAVALFVLGVAAPSEASRVLIVVNDESTDSLSIGGYYRQKRGIPTTNLVRISCPKGEDVSPEDFAEQIQKPVMAAIKKCPNSIDFIVLTKGIPIRVGNAMASSVDALLGATNLNMPLYDPTKPGEIKKGLNPYFTKDEPFSSKKYNFYLVTRLDGYTAEQARRLVDLSLAAKPQKGLFFFDEAGNRNDGSYVNMQNMLGEASEILGKKGYTTELDKTPEFKGSETSLMGYASWGSNDSAFNEERYKKLRFYPGAIAETYVSTSGRTFLPTTGGQSLIADLIAGGVTGVKGYVSEPYTIALAQPPILFDRYTSGRNLAESFYAASQMLAWKDVIIGDPLCAPYAKP